MTALLIGAAIGLAAGVLSGIVGIGGGVVIVPALVLLGLTAHEASGTSLAALLMPVGLLGVFEYAHRHQIKIHYAIGIAVGLTLGVAAGAYVAGRLSDPLLQRVFGVLLALLALKFLIFPATAHDAVRPR
ncbi:TSUP family transporter [Streptomyces silvisoli]|uniref:Probable membrane transporter protein n=1 Tax=Streptomyces silvisoli TaxID=3034235 RepID=A0ABT5ZPE3_9ACTN|nr:TSUP family transporter [Streptomyces silvisoli]MDF3291581.1 TSUP family transporter [Streptomyces silvisoli]